MKDGGITERGERWVMDWLEMQNLVIVGRFYACLPILFPHCRKKPNLNPNKLIFIKRGFLVSLNLLSSSYPVWRRTHISLFLITAASVRNSLSPRRFIVDIIPPYDHLRHLKRNLYDLFVSHPFTLPSKKLRNSLVFMAYHMLVASQFL